MSERDDQIDEFGEKADDLIATLGTIGDTIVEVAEATRRTRRIVRKLTAVFLVEMLLILLVGVGFIGIHNASNRIKGVTDNLKSVQTVQRQKALCPLYELLIATDTDQNRSQARDKEAYDHAFKVIKGGYRALNCASFQGAHPVLGSSN